MKSDLKLFYIYHFSHLIIWTLVPTFTNNNLPLDTIEALAWGSNLDWGFNKHPPISAVFVELTYFFFGNNDWAYYLLSQICVIFAFYIVFILSQEILKNDKLAIISVLLLEAIYFHNYTTPEFNVYVCQLPFRALTVLYCWKCFNETKPNIINWILLGFFCALGFLTHYLFIYLILGIKIIFFIKIYNTKIFKKIYFIPGTVFILILIPHIIWLFENDFITLTYGIKRTGLEDNFWFNHFKFPIELIVKQTLILLIFFFLLILSLKKFSIKSLKKDKSLKFLLLINFVPILLIIITSAIMGVKIRTMWLSPFYLFFGLMFIYMFKKNLKQKLILFYSTFIFLYLLSPTIYGIVSIQNENKRTDYEGKEIAYLVEKRWIENFSTDIKYVVGDEWFAGNLSYHLSSRPKWYYNIKDKINELDPDGGVIYTWYDADNSKQKICPGLYGRIDNQGICMIGK